MVRTGVFGLAGPIGGQPAPEDPAYYAPTFDVLRDCFGPGRLLYGSNWPVCERAATYRVVQAIDSAHFVRKGEGAAAMFFSENSRRVYGLPSE